MGMLTKVLDVLGGGTISTVFNAVKSYFPPSMTDQEKNEFSLRLQDAEHRKDLAIREAVHRADAEFNSRIKDMEGTASDLKTIPVIGSIVIFLRGVQRPVWGFFTLYADYQVFAGAWDISDKQESMLLAINLLVLGFLFGERAVKNITPLIGAYFGKK